MKKYIITIIAYFMLGALATPLFSQSVASQPNVIVILLDDLRYNDFSSTGAPGFFHTPNIDRIANEGALFSNAFVTLSLCKPSRATMLTGLYPHLHGVKTNDDCFCTDSTMLIPYMVQQQGYTTSFIGKYHFATQRQPNYDYWVSFPGGNGYLDLTYNINDVDTMIPGHLNNNLTRFAIDFVSKQTQSPFFLTLSHKTPHAPIVPPIEFRNLYETAQISTDQFGGSDMINKPSFLYNSCNVAAIPNIAITKQRYYESLKSVDDQVGLLLDTLEKLNILDSTLIIVTSDNGFILGEHGSYGKRLAYEESMRIPILVRYPKYINPGTIVTNNIGLNIDIPQTILSFTGASNQTQGISLLDLISGAESRTEFLYQYHHDPASGFYEVYPSFRSVRTLQYKYNRYACTELAEELYDMQNDPNEVTNLVYDPLYNSVLSQLRVKLDSLRIAFNDTAELDTIGCSILKYNQCCPTSNNLRTTNRTAFKSTVAWSIIADLVNYEIRGRKLGTTTWLNFSSNLNGFQFTGLSPLTNYEWQVRAVCDSSILHYAAWSELDTFMTLKECDPPSMIFSEVLGAKKVVLNWTSVPNADGYKLFGKVLGSNKIAILSFGPSDTSFIFNNVDPTKTYIWTVKTGCNSNLTRLSAFSQTDTFTTDRQKLSNNNIGLSLDIPELNVFPNPNQGIFNVTLNNWYPENASIKIYNSMGSMIKTYSFDRSNIFNITTIDLSDQEKGLYILKISSENWSLQHKIFIQ